MRTLFLTFVICALSLVVVQPLSARTWSSSNGKYTVEAELVEVKAGNVLLRNAGGEEITVPLARLSQSDRRYLESVGDTATSKKGLAADRKVNALLKAILKQHDVPALAGAIVSSDGLQAFGVAGVRKRGTKTRATPNDLWHLGSDTKAMTAALVARLVEQGQLSWDTTVADVFADGDFEIHPDFRDVTLLHLLSHRAGLPANLDLADYLGDDAGRERLKAVQQELAKPPQTKPGSNYEYSNLGYIIVGAMVEKRTGKSWQANMIEHVFRPLEMASVGFGGTGRPGKVDQPWSHLPDGQPVPLNGPAMDNPPVMGPAGRVHCTIQDWSKYVADFLRGMAGKPALLPTGDYKKLSTPPFGGDYALGWIVTTRDWGGGTVLSHSGSNTMNYATVWIAPQRDFALLACTNQGGDVAAAACDAAVVALLGYHSEQLADRTARTRPVDNKSYEKRSPFTAVRWQETQPEVQVDREWFKLVSLDGIPADDIVAFGQRTYGNAWQKRFAEDLVELLTRMGHPLQDTVTLVLQSLASSETQTRNNVPMTAANRQAIKRAADATTN